MAYKRPHKTMKQIISLSLFVMAFSLCLISCGGGSSSSSSEDYGEYHNVNTGERQSSYKGSVEQQEDIATLDKMIDEGY